MVSDSTLLNLRGKRQLLAILAMTVTAPFAWSHLLLYENIEVNLHDPARIRVEFTIHAPELPLAVEAGVDPAAVDESWLRGLDDDEIISLTKEAETFIRESFLLQLDSKELSKIERIGFDPPEQIRYPAADTKLPPGCLLGTVWLENPGPEFPLSVGFSKTAQKRLMVAIARPAAFPEVHDLAPGEFVEIALPDVPEPEINFPPRNISSWLIGIGLCLVLAVIGWTFRRHRRKSG